MCLCCREKLPLLFIVQKYKVWSYITVEDLGSVETSSWKMVHYAMPWLWRERFNPGADIEGNTLCYLYDATQFIRTNVVCSASTGITELPHVTIAPFYFWRVYYQVVIWNIGMESVIDARGGVIYATGLLGRCLWNPKIRPNQVPAHTQNKYPYKYQESRCQCFVCCLCTYISIHLDSTL